VCGTAASGGVACREIVFLVAASAVWPVEEAAVGVDLVAAGEEVVRSERDFAGHHLQLRRECPAKQELSPL
jgi:hypothetical protein